LILAGALLGFYDDKAKVFDVAIQTSAIFAVILVDWPVVLLGLSRKAARLFFFLLPGDSHTD
jgi:undecaprenyl-diphosphatase